MEKYKEKPDNKSTFEHKLIYYLYIFSHTAPVGKSRQGVDKNLIFFTIYKNNGRKHYNIIRLLYYHDHPLFLEWFGQTISMGGASPWQAG